MEEYSGEPIAIVDQTQKRRLPIQEVAPPEKDRHIGDYVVKQKRDCSPLKRTVPVIPLSSNAGVMRPQCVLSPSQPSECEEV